MTPTFSQFKDSDGQVYDCQITGRDGALLQIRYVRDGQVIEDAWITGDDLTSDKPTVGNPLLIEAERDQLRTQLEGLTKERDEAKAMLETDRVHAAAVQEQIRAQLDRAEASRADTERLDWLWSKAKAVGDSLDFSLPVVVGDSIREAIDSAISKDAARAALTAREEGE